MFDTNRVVASPEEPNDRLCLRRAPHTFCATIAATCTSQEEPSLPYFHPRRIALVKSRSANEIALLVGQHRATFGDYLVFDASICVSTSANPHDHRHCQTGQIRSHFVAIDPDWSYEHALPPPSFEEELEDEFKNIHPFSRELVILCFSTTHESALPRSCRSVPCGPIYRSEGRENAIIREAELCRRLVWDALQDHCASSEDFITEEQLDELADEVSRALGFLNMKSGDGLVGGEETAGDGGRSFFGWRPKAGIIGNGFEMALIEEREATEEGQGCFPDDARSDCLTDEFEL